MQANAVVAQLKERNINLEGQEYYAVVMAYVNKINKLTDEKTVDSVKILKQAGSRKGQEEANEALQQGLSNKNVVAILSSNRSNEEKIALLHEEAVILGCQRVYRETFSRGLQFAEVDDAIREEKAEYAEKYDSYKMLMSIKNDENSLDSLIKMRAGNANVATEEVKKVVLANIEAQEDKFIKKQTNFVGKVVSYLVDEECRLVKAQESAEIS